MNSQTSETAEFITIVSIIFFAFCDNLVHSTRLFLLYSEILKDAYIIFNLGAYKVNKQQEMHPGEVRIHVPGVLFPKIKNIYNWKIHY